MKPVECELLEECAELGVLDPGRTTEADGWVRDSWNALCVVRHNRGRYLRRGDFLIVCRDARGRKSVSALNPLPLHIVGLTVDWGDWPPM